jgi:spore maturation protein SpmA
MDIVLLLTVLNTVVLVPKTTLTTKQSACSDKPNVIAVERLLLSVIPSVIAASRRKDHMEFVYGGNVNSIRDMLLLKGTLNTCHP